VNLAIYGGTFDPVHRGHLEVARAAADHYSLDRVLFIPAGHPPHRPRSPGATFEHRYRMVEIACQADPRFAVSRLEAPDGERGVHYSIDTLHRVRAELAPGARLLFIIGTDAFAEIRSWHRWNEILSLVEFIVVSRPGRELDSNEAPEGSRVHWLRTVNVPISSTQIRSHLARGESVDAWLAPGVADYIRANGLYGPPPKESLDVGGESVHDRSQRRDCSGLEGQAADLKSPRSDPRRDQISKNSPPLQK
jgi:nicotinate-nucleotide adenylyltransferase